MDTFKYLLLAVVFAVVFVKACQSVCAGDTCRECVSSGYSCAWCLDQNFTAPRCQTSSSLNAAGCLSSEDPQSELLFIKDYEVTDSTGTSSNAIQVQPQEVKIVAGPREERTVTMTFRAANNYPVDIYFLFDNSLTMKGYIDSLIKLAEDIGQTIEEISSNYRLGYGIFQDKVILPFSDTAPPKLKDPCGSKNGTTACSPPFEFKHLLSMTKDIDQFKAKVSEAGNTGNLDKPEGTTDAIMQAVSCKDQIGWRPRSRKLLIMASNDRFHIAGDGKLAGIVMPNDGHCHLDKSGRYTKELDQDYPSVSQLTDIVQKNEVHIIFAVTEEFKDLFQQLSNRIPQSTVELLPSPNDPSNRNIKDIVEKKYKEMVSEVEMVYDKVEGVDIQIRARSGECTKLGTPVCKGLQIGLKIKFDVDIKVTECPADPANSKKQVVIYPDSLQRDQMVLDIEIACECDCKTNKNKWEINSDMCTGGNGTLKCGVCDCHDGRFGQNCECDETEVDSATSGCIRPGENSTAQCSGAGKCECGICKCDEGYSRTYCECNDKACGSFERKICGGSLRGRCVCGQCVCEDGYTGNTCECATSTETCIYEGTICNNAGTCQCGECKCQKGYIGSTCQTCFLCEDSVCDIPTYRKCAQCEINKDEKCPEDCPTELVDVFSSSENICSIKQADGCFVSFRVVTSDTNITILVQRTKTCPEPVDIAPIAAGVVGGVVFVGLLILLLWKLLTSIFDKMEYSKFQEDLKNCKWAQQDNPFYKGATTTYKNPMLDTSEPKADDK